MSFADGFAQGYGMVNETMKAKREEEERRAAAERQDKQFQQTYGLQNATLNAVKLQNIEQNKLKRNELDNQKNKADEDRKIDKQKADANDKEVNSNAAYKAAAAQAALITAQSSAALHNETAKTYQFERDQAERKQKKEDSLNYLRAKYWNPNTNEFVPPTTQEGLDDLDKHTTIAFSAGVKDIIGDGDKYHTAAKTLLDTFQNQPPNQEINSQNNPQAIDSINTLLKNHINIGVGENGITEKKVASIIPHQGTPTADNPSGIVYSVGLKVKQNGQEKIVPMTEGREPFNGNNAKSFTGNQLYNEANGLAAYIDTVNMNKDRLGAWIRPPQVKGEGWVIKDVPVLDKDGKQLLDAEGKGATQPGAVNTSTGEAIPLTEWMRSHDTKQTQEFFGNTDEKPGLNVLTNNQPPEEAHPFQDILDATKDYGKSVKDKLVGKDKQKMYMEQAQGIYNTYNQKTEPNLEIKRIMDSKKYNKEEKLKLLAELIPRQQKNQ